jgi:hypothetical protein
MIDLLFFFKTEIDPEKLVIHKVYLVLDKINIVNTSFWLTYIGVQNRHGSIHIGVISLKVYARGQL